MPCFLAALDLTALATLPTTADRSTRLCTPVCLLAGMRELLLIRTSYLPTLTAAPQHSRDNNWQPNLHDRVGNSRQWPRTFCPESAQPSQRAHVGATSCAKTGLTSDASVVRVRALPCEVPKFSNLANQNDSCTRCVRPRRVGSRRGNGDVLETKTPLIGRLTSRIDCRPETDHEPASLPSCPTLGDLSSAMAFPESEPPTMPLPSFPWIAGPVRWRRGSRASPEQSLSRLLS